MLSVTAGCGAGSGSPHGSTATGATIARSTGASTSAGDAVVALVAKTRSGVIRIEASGCAAEDIGTGFLIAPQLVATVEHVVDGASTIALVRNGQTLASGTVIGDDPARDVALVHTNKPLSGHIFQFASAPPALGAPVVALGFPLGLPLSLSQGLVSGTGRTIPIDGVNRQELIQTDAAVNPGNSGGPLLSLDTGQVMGLVDLGTSQANGIAFAVSAQVARPLLQAWQAAPQPMPVANCQPPSSTPSSPQNFPALPSSPDVTGHDSAGYNVGPGCSDNPTTSLPGCSDAPSVPAGDSQGTCGSGIVVDASTTSCPLAESVRSNYSSDGPVSGYSGALGRDYTLECSTGGTGTSGDTICLGQANGTLYVRWHGGVSSAPQQCDANIAVSGASCPFAERVFVAYFHAYQQGGVQANVNISATSPTSGNSHMLACSTDGIIVTCDDQSAPDVVTFPLQAVEVYSP